MKSSYIKVLLVVVLVLGVGSAGFSAWADNKSSHLGELGLPLAILNEPHSEKDKLPVDFDSRGATAEDFQQAKLARVYEGRRYFIFSKSGNLLQNGHPMLCLHVGVGLDEKSYKGGGIGCRDAAVLNSTDLIWGMTSDDNGHFDSNGLPTTFDVEGIAPDSIVSVQLGNAKVAVVNNIFVIRDAGPGDLIVETNTGATKVIETLPASEFSVDSFSSEVDSAELMKGRSTSQAVLKSSDAARGGWVTYLDKGHLVADQATSNKKTGSKSANFMYVPPIGAWTPYAKNWYRRSAPESHLAGVVKSQGTAETHQHESNAMATCINDARLNDYHSLYTVTCDYNT